MKYGIPKDKIKNICESQFKFTREKLQDIDLDQIKNEKDFDKVKTTFSFMGLGKLYLNFKQLIKLRKKNENRSNRS